MSVSPPKTVQEDVRGERGFQLGLLLYVSDPRVISGRSSRLVLVQRGPSSLCSSSSSHSSSLPPKQNKAPTFMALLDRWMDAAIASQPSSFSSLLSSFSRSVPILPNRRACGERGHGALSETQTTAPPPRHSLARSLVRPSDDRRTIAFSYHPLAPSLPLL